MVLARLSASYARKTCFWGPEKSSFSSITFFLIDVVENGQSKVCSASDARNFGTKFVGIEGLWPRFSPDRKMTRSGPLFILYDLQLFWLGRSSWFRCQSTGKCPAECRSHRYERMPGLPDPLWPVKLKNGYFWDPGRDWTTRLWPGPKFFWCHQIEHPKKPGKRILYH